MNENMALVILRKNPEALVTMLTYFISMHTLSYVWIRKTSRIPSTTSYLAFLLFTEMIFQKNMFFKGPGFLFISISIILAWLSGIYLTPCITEKINMFFASQVFF